MGRLVSFLWTWIDAIMAILMASMIVLVFTNVVMRYGFSSGLRVSVELSRLGFVWVVMLGAVVALRRGEHLAVSEFSEVFFPRAVPILRRFAWLVILVSVSMLFWGALRQTIANWSNISPLTGLPTGVMYLAGAVSGLLMAFVAISRLFGPPETVKTAPENK
ncbi:C4-dicarboxylate ABC transporter substrate-binding protein [Azospirillum thiophilum]|uniref:TRAP transporter small permease protein n=1 Tax=Azospirillum thiophilum TaxID=528244 RepID=A0AAC8VZP8_9PROT|nr:TRAP transporter small permease [Azospirillum thiophilum]ALG72454.1 C4-dicarboxylate ABC transporter substrate-binding protein [Azospirillum thiophilum]KJR61414.1 C4-dicarboxylate ABC transporter substrate-binding protein [Azospirillum thiophilum]